MWEKLKDFLYEISDILFALIIILLMSTVITWKITDSLAYSKHKNSLSNQTSIHMEHPESDSEKTDVSDTTKPEKENDAENHSTSLSPAVIQVDIPSGTPAANIAVILEENNLIQNTHDFIVRIEERQLANKLKFGTFQFEKESSLDEIIDILTGQH